VDRRGRYNLHVAEKSAIHTTSIGRTKRKRTTTTIYRSHTSSGKHGTSSWAKWRMKGARSPAAGIFS
jgi:hypothetical protein